MFIYKQSVYDTLLSYEKDNFKWNVNFESGQRIEQKENVEISSCEDMILQSEMNLSLGRYDLNKLMYILISMRKNLLQKQIGFSSYFYTHTEKVVINDLYDYRNYGFLKLVLEKNNNFLIEEIPITSKIKSTDILECKIKNFIYKNKFFINSSVSSYTHKKFINIPIVLSPHSAGFFVHEILGHTLENDFYTYYKDKYKNLNFSNKLNVKDDSEKGSDFLGTSNYDDLGIASSPITLVKDGKITNVLSLEPENSLDKKIYGVARRESYKHKVLPRMRCIYIEPKEDICKETILKKYKRCILIDNINSGSVNPQNGEYTLQGNGFFVDSGEIMNFIGDLVLSGNITKDFSLFDCIGNDIEFFGGYCFKIEQNIRVSIGGPTVSLKMGNVEGNLYE